MKFETVKSFILSILVVFSLLLTLGLWYYQPNYDVLYDEDSSVSEFETDIGGKKESISDVIKPNAMIFHNYQTDQHFTFKKPMDYVQLFNNMESWTLSDFKKRPVDGLPKDDEQIEIRFPTDIPMELLKKMFSIDDDVDLPTWLFNKAIVGFDKGSSILKVTFVSSDEKYAGTVEVHNKDAYDLLWGHMSSQENMVQLTPYDLSNSDDEPIYIPTNAISMTEYSLSIDETDPNKLVNALFSKPSLVSTTFGESYFTDGQRQMSLLHGERTVEFFDPYSDTYDKMDIPDLIDRTVQNINDHRGWTNDYYLSELTPASNQIKFQMHYKGYPVFSYSDLSTIEQQWREQKLHQYDRPLFQIKNELRQEEKELESGEDIMQSLTDNPNYNMSKVQDLKVGYKLSYDESTQSVELQPAWYVNYDGNWREANFDDESR